MLTPFSPAERAIRAEEISGSVGGECGEQPDERLREADPRPDVVEPVGEQGGRRQRDRDREAEERDCQGWADGDFSFAADDGSPTSLPGTPWGQAIAGSGAAVAKFRSCPGP